MAKMLTGEGIKEVILAIIGAFIITIVFLQLWAPTAGGMLRDKLYDLLNETNFKATYGTGVRDGLVYILDFLVILVFFAIWGLIGHKVLKTIEKGV